MMDDYEDAADIKHLVRRYSKVARVDMVDEQLAQGLAAKADVDIERERKGKFYIAKAMNGLFGEDDSDPQFKSDSSVQLAALESKSRELEETWEKFRDKLHLMNDQGSVTTAKQDISVVRRAIEKAQATLERNKETKVGRVKSYFSSVFQTLDNHSYLFALLPSGDKYTSVFTGAFSTIVNATATHQKIAAEISDGFDRISDQVRSFYFAIQSHAGSTYIRYHIALFYFELFGFLVCIMREWYRSSWKRLSKSLGSSFLEDVVQGTLNKLTRYTETVESEVTRRTREISYCQLLALGAKMEACLENSVKMQASQAKFMEYLETDFPGKVVEIARKEGHLRTNRRISTTPTATGTALAITEGRQQSLDTPGPGSYLNATASFSRLSIEGQIIDLKPYTQDSDVAELVDLAGSIFVNSEVFLRIRDWVACASSKALWIEGPHIPTQPSQNTLTSAFMLGNLRHLRIPSIVYFCQYDSKYWRTFDYENEILKVLYALIFQATQTLPERANAKLMELEFLPTRFNRTSGEGEAILEAIKLLTYLLMEGPPLQFCIIDGLQLLGGEELATHTRNSLKNFIEVLCKAALENSGDGKVVKILFTTDGFSGELADAANSGILSRETYEDEEDNELLSLTAEDLKLVK